MCDELETAVKCLIRSREYIKQARDEAEARHDSYGEFYMDGGMFEIMQETEKLLGEINIAVNNFKKL
jgi:hypothetical protein